MSDFSIKASEAFPGVTWNGRSHMHVSISIDQVIPGDSLREALKQAYKDGLAAKVLATLVEFFPQFEWLITAEEFEARCFVDMYRHSKGKGDTQDPSKLKNPSTGSVFHRVAIYQDYVGGIRFWFLDAGGIVHFGFRFRIQKLDEDDKKTRHKASVQAEEDKKDLQEILDEIAEPKQPEKKTGVFIHEKG